MRKLRSSSLLLVALSMTFLTACAGSGLSDKLPPPTVVIPQDCEALAQQVNHFPVVKGKTDARVAYKGEVHRLDKANDLLDATRECQQLQREQLGGKNAH